MIGLLFGDEKQQQVPSNTLSIAVTAKAIREYFGFFLSESSNTWTTRNNPTIASDIRFRWNLVGSNVLQLEQRVRSYSDLNTMADT
jgi:hypothetical protein